MTDTENPREGLSPLHRLLLDLGHLSQRYSDIATTADPEQIESLQEDVGSIFAAFGECAEAIEKIARQYLNPDGSVPNPVEREASAQTTLVPPLPWAGPNEPKTDTDPSYTIEYSDDARDTYFTALGKYSQAELVTEVSLTDRTSVEAILARVDQDGIWAHEHNDGITGRLVFLKHDEIVKIHVY